MWPPWLPLLVVRVGIAEDAPDAAELGQLERVVAVDVCLMAVVQIQV